MFGSTPLLIKAVAGQRVLTIVIVLKGDALHAPSGKHIVLPSLFCIKLCVVVKFIGVSTLQENKRDKR